MQTHTKASLPGSRSTPHGSVLAGPFHSNTSKIPTESDVVVIGGGIAGVSTAWFLARQGISVTLCEKGEIAGESSSRAFGWISELLLDPLKMELSSESKRLWSILQEECGELGYRQNGLVYLAESMEDLEFYEHWLEVTKGTCDPGNELLSPKGVKQRFPGTDEKWLGGIYSPTDGGLEPTIATTAIAMSAQSMGAKIMTNCAVRTVDTQSGSVAGVHTEHGYIRTAQVLYAGNTWSRLFCGNLDIDVPQLYAIMTMARTGPLENGPLACGGTHPYAWRQRIDNAYVLGREFDIRVPLTRAAFQQKSRFAAYRKENVNMQAKLSWGSDTLRDWLWPRSWSAKDITPFEKHRVLSPSIQKSVPQKALELNQIEFPEFKNTTIEEYWSGTLTLTPDNMPIASSIKSLPGFFLLTGASFGLTWGPALGKLMADLITGDKTSIDPTPFRHERFFDGSELKVTW